MTGEHVGLTAKQWMGGAIAAIVIVALLICLPKVQVYGVRHMLSSTPSHFNDEDRARQTLATIFGGMAVLGGAFLTFRSVRAAEKSAETARMVAEHNAETAQKNLKIAEDKQITDRFTAAVNNLSTDGPDKIAVRLGGIYALERIARDSPVDYWTVMEVLTAYVRDKRQKDLGRGRMETPTDIPTDVQATLTVIGRRDIEQDKGRKLDIYRVDLFKVYLAGANLRGAVMGENFMMQADLTGADLAGAYLAEADLTGADLRRANLWKANLWKADLLDADLTGARMQGTELHECENLTQQQLNASDQKLIPASLPPGLTFPGYVAPSPPPMPPA